MTVQLLAKWGDQPPGTLFSTDAATEAAMISANVATATLAGAVAWVPNRGSAAFLQEPVLPGNPGTGNPYAVSYILAQSAIPMIVPSSGTMGANGALTGLTALGYGTFPRPCFMYFPAGKVYSGSLAGMYYAVLTSATTATVYNNKYTSGLPHLSIPGSPTAVVDAGPGAYTQTTAAQIVLSAITVPGGSMGPNGRIHVTADWIANNNANPKTPGCRVSGVNAIFSAGLGSWTVQRIHGYLSNLNAQDRNVGFTNMSGGQGSGGVGTLSQPNQNTAVDFTIDLVATLATDTDYIALAAMTMSINPG